MWLLTSHKPQATRTARRAPSSIRPRLEALEDRCLPSGAGSLDPTFGGTGIVTTNMQNNSRLGQTGDAYAVLIQPWDGKIIAAGWALLSQEVMCLARYNSPNGTLDTSFGSGGKADSPRITNIGDTCAALYPHSGTANDGKIVVATGQTVDRFNPDGSLDKSFGKTGSVTVPWDIAYHGLVIQPWDGKIVVGGTELTRFNANGTLDTSFGSGGTVAQGANALQLQADGKLLISTGGGLARFNTNGSLDITFNSAGPVPGTVTTSIGVNCLAIYPGSGQIVAASGGGVVRFNANGTPDTTFGQSGQVTTSPNGAFAWATAVQADGKILLAGRTSDGSGILYKSLWRYTTDGSLNPTFGTGGLVQTSPVRGAGDAGWIDLALQADGRIVTVGTTEVGTTSNYTFMVARYLPSAPQVGSFTASPNSVASGLSTTLTAANISDGNPNSTITQVAFYVQQGGTNTLLGYGTQTSPGVWTFTFTVNLAPGTYTLTAVAEDSYGVFSDPFALALTVQ
jgi:uncharacterized delta-60 repeat protein